MILLPLPGVPDEEQLFKKPRQVVHKNTRFLRDPFSQALSRSQLQQAAALNAQVRDRASGVEWASSPFWSWPPPYVRTVLGLSRARWWGCVWVPMWRGLSLFSICGGFSQTRSVGQVYASSRGVGWARCGGQQRFLSPDLLQGSDSGRHGVEEVGGGGPVLEAFTGALWEPSEHSCPS